MEIFINHNLLALTINVTWFYCTYILMQCLYVKISLRQVIMYHMQFTFLSLLIYTQTA